MRPLQGRSGFRSPESLEKNLSLESLQTHIRALITIDETEAPVLSCYLNIEGGYRQALDRRIHVRRKTLEQGARRE